MDIAKRLVPVSKHERRWSAVEQVAEGGREGGGVLCCCSGCDRLSQNVWISQETSLNCFVLLYTTDCRAKITVAQR